MVNFKPKIFYLDYPIRIPQQNEKYSQEKTLKINYLEFRARAVVFMNCLKYYTWLSKISVSALTMDNTSTTLASLREFNWHCTIKVFFDISFLLNLLTVNFPHYIETSQLICIANVCNRDIPFFTLFAIRHRHSPGAI